MSDVALSPNPARLREVPDDALRAIYTPDVMERLWNQRQPSKHLIDRRRVLVACGPYPSNPRAAVVVRWLRAKKVAWDTYVSAAFSCGLFEGVHGADLRARLTGVDDEGFRSGMAECLACWILAGPLRLPLRPRLAGRNGSILDNGIRHPDGDMGVEVKAPFREQPTGVWSGDDADLLMDCLERANEQFRDDCRNVLFLVPQLRISVFHLRSQLIRAFFGQEKMTFLMNTQTGSAEGPMELEFFPEGKFLNRYRPDGRLLKSDGRPGYTRISAVVCVEERYADDENLIFHRMLVLHNPVARYSVPTNLWGDCPQFVLKDDKMLWTDGHALLP